MRSLNWGLVNFLLILMLHSHSTEALKILGIFPWPGHSHFIPIGHLMRGLANHGHEVVVLSHFPLKKPMANYTDISLAGMSPQSTNNVTYKDTLQFSQFWMEYLVHKAGNMACDLLSEYKLQQFLKLPKNTYDVIVVELFFSNCYFAFGKYLDAPVVGIVSSPMHEWLFHPFSVPTNTAYMPSTLSVSSQSMTFLERSYNTLLVNSVTAQIDYYIERQREHVEKFFGRRLTTMNELYDDIALVLVNSHHSISGIMPMPPGVIEVGGLHVHDDQQVLSPEIKKWLDDSKIGFIYLSFGSMVRFETFPPKTLKAFYETFKNIAPVRVLIKVADPSILPPGLPKNVRTSPWLPQVAVLKHPNIKLFITHGGSLGTQEAIAYGVPMIGLPIYADQHTNIRTYENKGVAIALNHEDITGESLTDAVKTVLNDPTYRKNVKTLANIFNDRPMSAMDTAIYWVEYAARHGNILQSPARRLTWWQYHLLDVYALFLFAVLLVLFIIKQSLKFVINLISSRKFVRAMMEYPKSKKVL